MVHLLNQRYRLIDRLGGGGMGNVYLAADTKLRDRLVAIKEMRQDQLKSPEQVEAAAQAFKQEAFMLAGLRHQNLPRIYDHFEEVGNWYLVMDFVEGQTLEDYRKAQGEKLPLGEVLDIGIQLCKVLHYLHTQQPQLIVFRDLKPSNIMRTLDGHIYLIDFGIARHFKPGQTRDTAFGWTPGYAPPEQNPYSAHLAQTTPQSDIYSLGATLHHLLTGHHPALNTPSVFDFAPLQSFDLSLPAALNTLIMQMVEKDAKDRPISVAVVKAELQRIADQEAGQQITLTGAKWYQQVYKYLDKYKYEKLYQQACKYLDKNKDEEALAALDQAIRLDPKNWRAFRKKGNALYSLRKYEEALAALDQAIRLNANDSDTVFNKGVILFELGRYEEALEAYDQASRLDPTDIMIIICKHDVLTSHLRRGEEAQRVYNQAIRLNSENYYVFNDPTLPFPHCYRTR